MLQLKVLVKYRMIKYLLYICEFFLSLLFNLFNTMYLIFYELIRVGLDRILDPAVYH